MKKIKLISLFLVVLMVFTACDGRSGDGFMGINKKQSQGKTLYLIGYNFENSNPLLVKNEVNREIFSLIYDGLYTLDETYSPVPRLAKETNIDETGLTYKVTLNEGVLFHDGTTLSANDVCATINYLISNSTYYSYNVNNIQAVKANGANEVVITLKKPAQNLEALLTFPIVNSKDILGEFTFNGTGMFLVENYIKRKSIDLKINDKYYREKNKELKKVSVQLMPDKETANYAYSSGLSDVFSQDIFKDVTSLNPKTGATNNEYTTLNYNFLLLNNTSEVLQDVRVRRAISLAINREVIVEDILFSHAKAVYSPIPTESFYFDSEVKDEYNVNVAKTLLLEGGYVPDVNTGIMGKETEDGVEELSFTISVNNDNNFRIQVANYISENLKYIGIDATVEVIDYYEYADKYVNKTYEALLGSVMMAPDFDLTMFMGDYNITNYVSDAANKELSLISQTGNREIKKEHYNNLQRIFNKEAPHISLYYTKANLQNTSKVKKGLKPTGFNIFNNIEKWTFDD